MYTVSVRRDFVARHYLIGGEWGDENNPHAHDYTVEIRLQGNRLNKQGFLVDIVEVEKQLNLEVGNYENAVLNDLAEFAGINPSLEHFAKVICSRLSVQFHDFGLSSLEVRLWESKKAWASFRQEY